MRCKAGTDGSSISDRVAFIEKTPRVRIRQETSTNRIHPDWLNWAEGPKGDGGSGDPEAEQLYGFYPPSRQWCDAMLPLLGYDLS